MIPKQQGLCWIFSSFGQGVCKRPQIDSRYGYRYGGDLEGGDRDLLKQKNLPKGGFVPVADDSLMVPFRAGISTCGSGCRVLHRASSLRTTLHKYFSKIIAKIDEKVNRFVQYLFNWRPCATTVLGMEFVRFLLYSSEHHH